jgi:hypothetical protein
MTLTFTYANSTTPIAGVKVIMTESDGTVTILTTDFNGQITLPSTNNTYTLSASLAETGEDPISLLDAIHILQYAGELRTLTNDEKTAADVNVDGEVDVLDAIWILQHLGELRTLDSNLIFLDANTGNPLSETTFTPGDTPSISVIRMGDVNGDFEPSLAPRSITLSVSAVDESIAGAVVGSLTTYDQDSSRHEYSLSGTDAENFEIINGILKLKDGIAANYEVNNSYSVAVTATDASGLSVSNTFNIVVNNVNEAPSSIVISNQSIYENEAGAIVGTLTTNDDDFGDTHTYTLSGTDAELFEIVNGIQLKLKDSVSANYEVQNNYSVIVTATDSEGLTTSQSFSVSVLNINDGEYILIQGTNGNDILIGTDGEDRIEGSTNVDSNFENGYDILEGGQGDDILVGGNNSSPVGGYIIDIYRFADNSGDDIILGFLIDGTGYSGDYYDKINILTNINGTGITQAADLLSRISTNEDGWAVLDLGSGNTITFHGIIPNQLKTHHFEIITQAQYDGLLQASSSASNVIIGNTQKDATSDIDEITPEYNPLSPNGAETSIKGIVLPEIAVPGDLPCILLTEDTLDLLSNLIDPTPSVDIDYQNIYPLGDAGAGIDLVADLPFMDDCNLVLDHYQDPWLEDLVYTSELG